MMLRMAQFKMGYCRFVLNQVSGVMRMSTGLLHKKNLACSLVYGQGKIS
jgi:hypothetical protein